MSVCVSPSPQVAGAAIGGLILAMNIALVVYFVYVMLTHVSALAEGFTARHLCCTVAAGLFHGRVLLSLSRHSRLSALCFHSLQGREAITRGVTRAREHMLVATSKMHMGLTVVRDRVSNGEWKKAVAG